MQNTISCISLGTTGLDSGKLVKTELNMAERGAELDAPVRRAEELDVLG